MLGFLLENCMYQWFREFPISKLLMTIDLEMRKHQVKQVSQRIVCGDRGDHHLPGWQIPAISFRLQSHDSHLLFFFFWVEVLSHLQSHLPSFFFFLKFWPPRPFLFHVVQPGFPTEWAVGSDYFSRLFWRPPNEMVMAKWIWSFSYTHYKSPSRPIVHHEYRYQKWASQAGHEYDWSLTS